MPGLAKVGTVTETFLVFLRLGLSSFGGPIAHLGYFRNEFVERRRWLDDRAYADLVALAQFLPGPSSSQVGMGVGLLRAGLPGMVAAWAGFTLPSALALVAFAYGASLFEGATARGVTHGLMLAAAAVVAQAVILMARSLAPDLPRAGLATGAAAVGLLWPGALGQIGVLLAGGLIGLAVLRPAAAGEHVPLQVPVGRKLGGAALMLFFVLLLLLPLAAGRGGAGLQLFEIFYRAGSLVFGGGHVVLPLLETALVPRGFIGKDAFLAGYGAAQAVPGPLFTFSAYIGAALDQGPRGVWGAAICLSGMFAPSFLLVPGAMPFWARLSHLAPARAAMAGVNAAVVGILAAAFLDPVAVTAIHGVMDAGIALAALGALVLLRLPAWAVVLLCGGAGILVS